MPAERRSLRSLTPAHVNLDPRPRSAFRDIIRPRIRGLERFGALRASGFSHRFTRLRRLPVRRSVGVEVRAPVGGRVESSLGRFAALVEPLFVVARTPSEAEDDTRRRRRPSPTGSKKRTEPVAGSGVKLKLPAGLSPNGPLPEARPIAKPCQPLRRHATEARDSLSARSSARRSSAVTSGRRAFDLVGERNG